jgi:hypothetical protein
MCKHADNHPKIGEKYGLGVPQKSLEGTNPADTLVSGCKLSELWENKFNTVWRHTICDNLLWQFLQSIY